MYRFVQLYDLILNFSRLRKYLSKGSAYPKVHGRLIIEGKGSLKTGKGVIINSNARVNRIGGDTRTVIQLSHGARLHIGDYAGISNTAIVCRSSVHIEDYVQIGASCKIYDTDFHSLRFEDRVQPIRERIPDPGVREKPIRIRSGAWIGGHTIILKGVTIGERAVVGAGSVVRHDIPADEIWAGNPAVFVRKI